MTNKNENEKSWDEIVVEAAEKHSKSFEGGKMSDKEQGKIYFNPKCFIIGIVKGNFIEFLWNGRMEESFFGVEDIKNEWEYIGDL